MVALPDVDPPLSGSPFWEGPPPERQGSPQDAWPVTSLPPWGSASGHRGMPAAQSLLERQEDKTWKKEGSKARKLVFIF